MAQFWMHNGFLQVEGEKMAKSLGNFVTIRELLQEWPGDVIRYQMLMTHYRQPMDWTKWATEQAAVALDSFRVSTRGADAEHGRVDRSVLEALQDDLNTPQVIAELHRLAGETRKGNYQAACDLRVTFGLLGIDLDAVDLQEIVKRHRGDVDEAKVKAMIDARNAARKVKNFAEADRIRDELSAMGIVLHDNKDGTTTWEVVSPSAAKKKAG
jgi:cysteinyl-tRNA synthetase